MAGDKAVENLPEVVTAGLSGTDWLHVIQGVNSRKTSLGSLYDWIVVFSEAEEAEAEVALQSSSTSRTMVLLEMVSLMILRPS
jgi:hypothetical protein